MSNKPLQSEIFTKLSNAQSFFIAEIFDFVEADENDQPITGRDLLEMLLDADMYQQDVIRELMSRRDATKDENEIRKLEEIISILMGKEIYKAKLGESSFEEEEKRRKKPTKKNNYKSDPRRVISVAPNPKRPNSSSYFRYNQWRVGETVDDAIARGLSHVDVAHDVKKGFVVLEK